MKHEVVIFWFRRDLRLTDNAGLYHALKSGCKVLPLFIFDTNILDDLKGNDPRVTFIHQSISRLSQELESYDSNLLVEKGDPYEVFQRLMIKYEVKGVFCNHDFETYARNRDHLIQSLLERNSAYLKSYKDHVIFEKNEVLKDDGSPYTVFTPYSRKWKAKMTDFYLKTYPTENYFHQLLNFESRIPELREIGFSPSAIEMPLPKVADELISSYHATRDIPSINGTSRIGVHLRFGTISIRQLAYCAERLNATYLNELIWRDFYAMILYHFPRVEHGAFKPGYDRIKWLNDESDFERWCDGQIGYPIVDAGMRELNATGFMHNRVRMIVASFLTKHLLIDWRWGEAYFAEKLLDFDLASNNGGWQWAAGSGCDAAPYFRVFNPQLQTKKFDPTLTYVRKWVPEFQSFNYPSPMVEHSFARKRALDTYAKALVKNEIPG